MNTKRLEDIRNVFGMVFVLAQRWQHLGDIELANEGITTKQWLLLVTISNLFDDPPNLNELTLAYGGSRQNVKQLALNLEKRGFLEIYQDTSDRRVLRFKVTEECDQFWNARKELDIQFIEGLFEDVAADGLMNTSSILSQLMQITDVKLSLTPTGLKE